VKIQPEEWLANTSEQNPASGLVTDCDEAGVSHEDELWHNSQSEPFPFQLSLKAISYR